MLEKMQNLLRQFAADEKGLAAVEYGLLAAGIVIGLWTLIQGMGSDLKTIYTAVQADLGTAAS